MSQLFKVCEVSEKGRISDVLQIVKADTEVEAKKKVARIYEKPEIATMDSYKAYKTSELEIKLYKQKLTTELRLWNKIY